MNEKEEKKEVVGAVETLIDRDRVLSFSDAIFAFAATLLVLKIDIPGILPHQVESSFFQVLAHLWPQYFANIVSFLMISYYWLCHHAVFCYYSVFLLAFFLSQLFRDPAVLFVFLLVLPPAVSVVLFVGSLAAFPG
jgi:uncharacterized membrane protein